MRNITTFIMFPEALWPRHSTPVAEVDLDGDGFPVTAYGIYWRCYTVPPSIAESGELLDRTYGPLTYAEPDDDGICGPLTPEATPPVVLVQQVEDLFYRDSSGSTPNEQRFHEVLWLHGKRCGSLLSDAGGPLIRLMVNDHGVVEIEEPAMAGLRDFNRGLHRVRNAITTIEAALKTLEV